MDLAPREIGTENLENWVGPFYFPNDSDVPRIRKLQRHDSHTDAVGLHRPENSIRLSTLQDEIILAKRTNKLYKRRPNALRDASKI